MEDFEGFSLVARSYADTIIPDDKDRTIALGSPRNLDDALAGGIQVFESVVEEIGEYLVDLDDVPGARRKFTHVHRSAGLLDLNFHGLLDTPDQGVHVERLDLQSGAAKTREAK